MNPSRLFILRPVATSLVMLAILIAGALAYRLLSISSLPEVDFPTIQVTTLYPGAGPDVMLSHVTAPLEDELGEIAGLDAMSSTSTGGASLITLRFGLDSDLGVAEQEVQAALNQADTLLPDDLPRPPSYSKVNPADTPVLTLAVTSDSLPLTEVHDLVDTRLAQKLAQIGGVGEVRLAGGNRPAVRIDVDARRLAAHGLDLAGVRNAVESANVNQAKGTIYGPYRAYSIDANDQLTSAAGYRDLILKYENGAPLRLSDVASIDDGAENAQLGAWANGKGAILIDVLRQPGANVVGVVDDIERALPTLSASLPGSVDVEILSDRTTTIRAAVEDVQFELILAVGLVIMVTFLFLRNLPATLIPSLAVPLSLVGTFGAMYLAGFSLNNLTLMALTIATGFVIDDAIVVLENITRYLERGESPLQAALKGSRQIAFTILSLTVSLLAVLIPLLFMSGVVGVLFREFAMTLAISIVISAFVSLTLTPMLCARWLRSHDDAFDAERPPLDDEALVRSRQGLFGRLTRGYERALDAVLRHQRATLWVALGTFALTAVLFWLVPKQLFPVQDTGTLRGVTTATQSTSYQAMAARQQALAARLMDDPAVANIASSVGIDGTNTTLNGGRLQIDLVDLGARDASLDAIIARLDAAAADVPGIDLALTPVQDLTLEDTVSRYPYQFALTQGDRERLAKDVAAMTERLQDSPAIAHVATDLQNAGRKLEVSIDRERASRLGVSVADIDDALYDAFGQRLISTIFTQSNQYRVVLGATQANAEGPEALERLYVSGSDDAMIPLSSLVSIEEAPTALSRQRLNQFPSALMSFAPAADHSLSEAFAAVEAARDDVLAADTRLDFRGTALAFTTSTRDTLWLIAAAIVTMYIVLGVLYESYIHPLTILSTLPSAAIGALLALMLSQSALGMVAVIGIILLIGIVKKNAIMMIDFALEAQREQGMSAARAIHSAALLRFRPIMMTTFAALLGALPLMLASGYGAELRRPLGMTMVGGLLLSQLLTLFTTPVIYLFFDRLAERWHDRRQRRERTHGASS
ncbi:MULTISPECIES: efflux RND transporter permease subunit [Chromohalobacter]|uniref:efflux RND transporter permease subunit n=1 Tax=Chromohalobacter TaxID=42054 RepID=UPI0015C4C3AF|nr:MULTISPECIES: efflux RND transporter permease subunit [Chromohalobacter]MBZ5877181.1 efflux RND transporter permease subunit [Chromohalobacter salexigens]NQY44529.1 efflux RND transporter permease subunit [Chromohalobacter sp.]NWO54710.1 multidrug transporter subunit MdtC [Chromohalobacter salexigens]